ncbi:hypothetical protein EDWATA_00351 [Edwardsiella tarda ATCC 23685]|uniref:Uncharacterized protein n=1 Tax=Edwardsiella tarda ATCC 23685 TaxID=500638 RepID=D4F0X0_EDWTA|nr:hypothetical protein EDWATA_00351 [Edwardsiella tarda ATCC 23685]
MTSPPFCLSLQLTAHYNGFSPVLHGCNRHCLCHLDLNNAVLIAKYRV